MQTTKTIGQWEAHSNMLMSRRYASVCDLDGNIYVIGGENNGGGAMTSVEMFDKTEQTWKSKQSFRSP